MKTQLLSEFTHSQQSSLADYCRTGELKPIQGLTEGRVQHYRRLVYNVIEDSLQSAFPLTYSLLDEAEWEHLVHDFFSTHNCSTPQVWKLAFEFYEYTLEHATALLEQYPQLSDLLLFEWYEVEVYMMDDIAVDLLEDSIDIFGEQKVLNREFKLMALTYPVHLKAADQLTAADKGAYYALLHRHPESGKVLFSNLSVYYAWLVEHMLVSKMPLQVLISEASTLFGVNNEHFMTEQTRPFIADLQERQFLRSIK